MTGPIEDSLKAVIRHGLSLQATCRRCSKKTIIDPRYIARKVDPRTSIHKLPLLCSNCKTKDAAVTAYFPDWE